MAPDTTTNNKREQDFLPNTEVKSLQNSFITKTIQQELNDALKACELFACFTANIINEKTLFTR